MFMRHNYMHFGLYRGGGDVELSRYRGYQYRPLWTDRQVASPGQNDATDKPST